MAKAKKFIKKKTDPGTLGPNYRTSDFIKQSRFSGSMVKNINIRPNTSFKTQHKG